MDNNKKQGIDCQYYYKNGDVYKGPFLRDVKETKDGQLGELEMLSSQAVYKGQFQDDQKRGQCQIKFGVHGK